MGGSLGDVPRRFGGGCACCICQATRVTPLCIKADLMTESSSCKSLLRRLIWPHGSEMCWIGRQQAATSHSQGATLVGLENFHYDQSWKTIMNRSGFAGGSNS